MVEKTIETLFKYGPGWVILGLIIVALWKSGALVELAKRKNNESKLLKKKKTGSESEQKIELNEDILSDYVLRENCHKSLDKLNSYLEQEFSNIQRTVQEFKRDITFDIREMRKMIFEHINGGK